MTTLIIANAIGGLYNFRKELIKEITRVSSVIINAPLRVAGTESFINEFTDIGCTLIDAPIERRGTNPLSDLKLMLRYNKLIRLHKPDVVLTYTIKPNIYGGLACRLTKTPQLANITGFGDAVENGGFMQKLLIFLYKVGLKKTRLVYCQNTAIINFLKTHKICYNNYCLIPGSGVNLSKHCFEPYPETDSSLVFLYIGRLMRDKGIVELAEAAKRVRFLRSNIRFLIVGSFEKGFQSELKGIDESLEILGPQKDVHPYLKECHALINPSYHEGMSNVCLEAAATGRPVLASNIPGCRETFDEGITGFGFEPKNVDSLVAAIEKFIALPYEQKAAMGLAGRRKMEREFDRNIVINAYMEEIKAICGVEQSEDKHESLV